MSAGIWALLCGAQYRPAATRRSLKVKRAPSSMLRSLWKPLSQGQGTKRCWGCCVCLKVCVCAYTHSRSHTHTHTQSALEDNGVWHLHKNPADRKRLVYSTVMRNNDAFFSWIGPSDFMFVWDTKYKRFLISRVEFKCAVKYYRYYHGGLKTKN